MRARQIRLGLTAALAGAAACTSWSRLERSRPVPARATVQVWSGGKNTLLREAKTSGDSLVGRAPAPDTTRLAFSLATVDSVRMEDLDMGKVVIVGTGVLIALVLAYGAGLQGME
jgi:hypothetical protein